MTWDDLSCRVTAGLLLALLPAAALAAPPEAFHLPSSEGAEVSLGVLPAFVYQPASRAGATAGERGHAIAADLGLLARNPDQLRIDLPDGRSYVAFRTLAFTQDGDRLQWNGDLHRDGYFEEHFDGVAAFTLQGESLTGSLRVEDATFEISAAADGGLRLLDITGEPLAKAEGRSVAKDTCGADAALAADIGASSSGLAAPLAKSGSDSKGGPPAPLAVIDVLVIFPQSLAGAQLAATRTLVDNWFADSTVAFANSEVPAQFRPVYVGPLYGEQPPRPYSGGAVSAATTLGLGWMQGNFDRLGVPLLPGQQPVPPEEVIRLRDHFGADYVLLLVPPDNDPECGVAETSNPRSDQFAAIDIGCARSEYLVAHELGHVLGMRHAYEEYPAPPTAPYTYAFGYDNTNQLQIGGQFAATMMACNLRTVGNPPTTTTCSRILYYSDPARVLNGVAIGTATANNTQVARIEAPFAAARRTATGTPGNLPPSLTITSPRGTRGQVNAVITLEAGAYDHEDGDRSASIVWTSSARGYLGTGARIPTLRTSTGTETITATVTDSGGLSFSRSVTLVFDALVVTSGAIWHNPRQPGKFLSFNKNDSHYWVATWMSYEGSSPVWYQSNVVLTSPTSGGFATQLIRYTRNTSSGEQYPTYFGDISIAVETDKQLRLTVTPMSGQGVTDLLLEPYTRTCIQDCYGSYWSTVEVEVEPDVFETQVDPGWMIWRGPTDFGPAGQEARLVITFDGSQPVWTIGVGKSGGVAVTPFFNMPMHLPSPAGLTNNYFVGNLPNVGSLEFQSDGEGTIVLNFPSSNSWYRFDQDLVPATVR